jgi:hypothetical protein
MDTILYWNEVALEANKVSHSNGKNEQTGPTLSSRALGIVHLAMYDAYAGASGYPAGLSPYLNEPAPADAPFADNVKDAAVAAAAHATLSKLFPSQKAFFDLKHQQAGLSGSGLKAGHDFGLLIAQKLLTVRKDDPGAGDDGYAASMARGAHRPDPDNPGQGFHAPFYGAKSKCFSVTVRHNLDSPPQPGNSEYTHALREVKSKGIAPELMATVPAVTLTVPPVTRRTVDQTLIGIYWGYDGSVDLGTPPRFYNQIVREVAMAQNNTVAQNARLFALINVAMADAGILAWEQKYIHDLWRPVVGIREHDPSMGPTGTGNNNIDNDCHTLWLPLGAPKSNSTSMEKNFTPPFPAYPSGHATFGAAAFHIARLFYGTAVGDRSGDNLCDGLTFVSDEFNGVNKDNKGTQRPRHVRNFSDGLWQMIEENGRSRVYLGVHWVFDAFAVDGNNDPDLTRKVGGVRLGLDIAEDIFSTGMMRSNV